MSRAAPASISGRNAEIFLLPLGPEQKTGPVRRAIIAQITRPFEALIRGSNACQGLIFIRATCHSRITNT